LYKRWVSRTARSVHPFRKKPAEQAPGTDTNSPNLNLIERLWKFTKNKVLYSRYYATFGEFQDAIRSFLDNAHQTHREELDSLLTLRVQTFAGCA